MVNKKIFMGCFITAVAMQANAQDIIVQRDGTTIMSKVIEVGTTEVKYKKWSNQDGPMYSIAKADLLSINYQNGDKDDFSKITAAAQTTTASDEQGQREIAVPLDEELNKRIIAECNTDDVVFSNEEEKEDKQAKSFWYGFYAKEDAQFANEEIEVKYSMGITHWDNKEKAFTIIKDESSREYVKSYGRQPWVIASIKNRTNKTIFIDLGNTFFIRGEEAAPYYVPTATSTTQGGSSGASVNLGSVAGAFGVGGTVGTLASGINVGGSNLNSSTTVTYSQRVISIPPLSTKQLDLQLLVPENNGVLSTKEYKKAYIEILSNTKCNRGEAKYYTYDTTPFKWGTYITYSTQENFSTYSHLSARFYINKVIGGRYNAMNGYTIKAKDFSGDIFRENGREYTKGFYLLAEYKD